MVHLHAVQGYSKQVDLRVLNYSRYILTSPEPSPVRRWLLGCLEGTSSAVDLEDLSGSPAVAEASSSAGPCMMCSIHHKQSAHTARPWHVACSVGIFTSSRPAQRRLSQAIV